MNYIVFDLELNMFFRFREGGSANQNLKSEIIQIGAVKLSETLETVSNFNLVVKPVVYRRINPYVKKKTNINDARIAQGTPIREATESFRTWAGDEAILCSWGHDDILALRDNCRFFGIESIAFDKYVNIQQIYMKQRSLFQQPSLESAVEDLEIQVAAPFHDALSDALYTAAIFRKIYDLSPDAIINWEKIQKENEEKIAELKKGMAKVVIQCPECCRIIPKETEVMKAKKYFAFGYCPACKLRVRNASRIAGRDGEFQIVSSNTVYKTVKESEKLLDKEDP